MCREGRRFFTPSLNFIYHFSKTDKVARLGLSVSRKTGNAVDRNYFKRIIREIFRTKFPTLPLVQVQISPRKKVHEITYHMALTEFDLFVRKITPGS